MDSTSIELKGSRISAVDIDGDSIRVVFEPAYLVKTMTGSVERTRWWQNGELVFEGADEGIDPDSVMVSLDQALVPRRAWSVAATRTSSWCAIRRKDAIRICWSVAASAPCGRPPPPRSRSMTCAAVVPVVGSPAIRPHERDVSACAFDEGRPEPPRPFWPPRFW